MELNEAIETVRENGFILEDVSPDNKMIYRGKATNLYKAAVCCLKHDNYARSRDLLADEVVTNWHNLTPLMMKTSDSGQKYFKNTVSSSPNASYLLVLEPEERSEILPSTFILTCLLTEFP